MNSKCAILCVDDDVTILQSIKAQLKNHFHGKYRYETAESAEDAMEILDELVGVGIQVLIIVSDWLMPGIKGDEFLILVHNKYPQIVTVMLTGQAGEASIANARKSANLFRYINKPWQEEELIAAIEEGLATL